MALKKKSDLKARFLNGQKPNQEDFENLIDSCYGWVESGQLDAGANMLQLNSVGAMTGEASIISVDVSKLNQTLAFDPLTNSLRISGHPEAVHKVGYWIPKAGASNGIAHISTDNRVGIKTSSPLADLHVNGGFKIGSGKTITGVAASLTESGLDSKVPTVAALKSCVPEMVLHARLDDAATFNVPKGGGRIPFPQVVYKRSNVEYSNSTLTIPENGLYRVEVNLSIESFNAGGAVSFLALMFMGDYLDYMWFVPAGTSGNFTLVSVSKVLELEKDGELWLEGYVTTNGELKLNKGFGQGSTFTVSRVGDPLPRLEGIRNEVTVIS